MEENHNTQVSYLLSFIGVISIFAGFLMFGGLLTIPIAVSLVIGGCFMVGLADIIKTLRENTYNTKRIYNLLHGQILQSYSVSSIEHKSPNDEKN